MSALSILAADEPKAELFVLRAMTPPNLAHLGAKDAPPVYLVHVRDTAGDASEFRVVAVFEVDGKIEARALSIGKASDPNSAFSSAIISFKAGQRVRLLSASVDAVIFRRGAEVGAEAQ